jgi:tetratricopeptide (TPR) repeat protein
MKRIILTLTATLLLVAGFSQPNKRVEAYNHHRYGNLDKAKAAIDEAAQHEKTIADAKTWFYRGNIYYDIGISTNEEYRKLDPDPLGVAWASYKKALELDEKGEFKEDIIKFTMAVAEAYYNQGVTYYNAQDFKSAAQSFGQAATVNQSVGRIDTTAVYNAAIAAGMANEDALAKEYLQKTISLGFQRPDVYVSLAEIYKREGDTTMALQTIQYGRKMYPVDFGLLIAETNIYLATDEKEKAMADLELAKQMDSTNPTIFFAVGTIYDQMGDLAKAESAYLQAIAINPDYFEANYNIGALYVNQAADILAKANDLPLNMVKEYETEKAKADGMLSKSLPYLEKALALNPEDLNTMVSLKEIYTRLGMMDKLGVIDEKLNK